ncbi:hypothetical protein AMTRI_Chr11g158640 [Amborella trichopoda]
MPKVSNCPHFVSDRMLSKSPKYRTTPILYQTAWPKCRTAPILCRTSCFPEAKCRTAPILCQIEVLDRLHFVLDRMLFKGYFGLYFTFL